MACNQGPSLMTTEILVCVLCRPPELPRDQPRPGRALFEAIEEDQIRRGVLKVGADS